MGGKVRFRAEIVNQSVGEVLSKIKVEKVFKEIYSEVVDDFLKTKNQSGRKEKGEFLKKIEVLQNRIINLENKFADDEISSQDFTNMKKRYTREIEDLKTQVRSFEKVSRGLKAQIDYCMKMIDDIGEMYENAEIPVKREIVGSIFPENLIFSKEKVRTTGINEVVKLLSPSIKTYEQNNSEKKRRKSHLSAKVPGPDSYREELNCTRSR